MKNTFLLLISSLVFNFANATDAPKLRSAEALTSALEKNVYSAQLKTGFHFNDKAPNQLLVDGKAIKPTKFAAQSVEFDLPNTYQNALALLYVCDDAITYCETHRMPIKGKADNKAAETKPKTSTTDHLGFWNGQLDQALQTAKKKNQLVLLDFTAVWCPGCNRNKGEVFSKAEFKKFTRDVVKVKIDTDLYENFALSEKFQIKGIPTLVLVNANEQEIDRLVGFEPVEKVETFVTSAKKDPTPLQDWMKLDASADSKLQLRAGKRLLAAGKTAESIPFLEKVQPAPPELLLAKTTFAQEAYEKDNAGQKEAYQKALRQAIVQEGDSTRSLVWRTELVKLDPKSDEAKTNLESGIKLADELMKDNAKLKTAIATDSVGEFAGFDKWVVTIYKADLMEAADVPEEELLKVMSQAADLGFEYKIPFIRKGPALRQLVMLTSAKRWTEADTYSAQLLKADPKNTDIQRRRVRILTALKRYDEAISLGERLLPQVEGRNEFWLAEGLAKAYAGKEKKAEAKKLLTAYLARPEIEASKMKSSKKSMEELLKKGVSQPGPIPGN